MTFNFLLGSAVDDPILKPPAAAALLGAAGLKPEVSVEKEVGVGKEPTEVGID